MGYIRPDGEYLKLTKLFSTSAFDIGSNKIWDSWNQGVRDLSLSLPSATLSRTGTVIPEPLTRTHADSLFIQRQWKDIKHRYMVKEEEDDE